MLSCCLVIEEVLSNFCGAHLTGQMFAEFLPKLCLRTVSQIVGSLVPWSLLNFVLLQLVSVVCKLHLSAKDALFTLARPWLGLEDCIL